MGRKPRAFAADNKVADPDAMVPACARRHMPLLPGCCRTCAPGADTYKTLRVRRFGEARHRHRRPRNSGPSVAPRVRQRLGRQEDPTSYRSPSPSVSAQSGSRLPPIGNQTDFSSSVTACSAKNCDPLAFFGATDLRATFSDDLLPTTRCFPISRLSQPCPSPSAFSAL